MHALIAAAVSQMARFYGLPVYATGLPIDEISDGFESVISASKFPALAHLSRGDITAGLGSLGGAESSGLEKVILDVEIWEEAKAYLRRFRFDDETLSFDAIREVGPGGNFLGLKHTLEHFQKEIWLGRAAVLPATNRSLVKKAKEKVRQILSTYIPPQLDEEVSREVKQILRNCERDMLCVP